MTFDFFNISNLAFGDKLTSAFIQLDNLTKEAENNLEYVLNNQQIFQQYVNRNYRVPIPIKPEMACRVDELFNLIKNIGGLKKLDYDKTTHTLTVDYVEYNEDTDRITHVTGSTDIFDTGNQEGYCFFIRAVSNKNLEKEARFSFENDRKSSEIELFRFRLNKDASKLIVLGDNPFGYYEGYDTSQYSSVSKGDDITFPYTSNGYNCILVKGNLNNINVKVNGKTTLSGTGNAVTRYNVLYLKDGDKIEGSLSTGFEINYGED